MELATCEYLDRGDDVVLAGPIGTGKTMLAIALGVEAARRRKQVLFTRAADLVRDLVEARDDRQLGSMQRRFRNVDLLICDELGFVPFDRAGGELLFNMLSDRYERKSTILTTNLDFGEWCCSTGTRSPGFSIEHNFLDPSHGAGDHCGLARHRFQIDDPEGLVDRRTTEHRSV